MIAVSYDYDDEDVPPWRCTTPRPEYKPYSPYYTNMPSTSKQADDVPPPAPLPSTSKRKADDMPPPAAVPSTSKWNSEDMPPPAAPAPKRRRVEPTDSAKPNN